MYFKRYISWDISVFLRLKWSVFDSEIVCPCLIGAFLIEKGKKGYKTWV